MFDIIKSANILFGETTSFCKEILFEFNCGYIIKKQNLPSRDNLTKFLGLKPERDKIEISITSDSETVYVGSDVDWKEKYETFLQSLYDDDDLNISIKVTKGSDAGRISIYSLKGFTEFLCGLKTEQIFENFTKLFSKFGEHISFQLLNEIGLLKTNSIVFSNNDVAWMGRRPREELLKDCQDASIFLERSRIQLIPQDFKIDSLEGTEFSGIKDLFCKLQTTLSYIYIANTATVVNGKAILQFDPSAKGYEYELGELTANTIVPLIYDWAFGGDSCVDKAGITRKMISTYCRDRESILTIDERVLNSIKSDYVIYQKNHVDQYIDMKNKISGYIVESAEKIQDLSHDIADAFRNNFVAIIVFLMTVLLTDSIDFSQLFGKETSSKIIGVCGVFTVATFLYFLATIIMGNLKWAWLKQSYKDLKENYKGFFDDRDIEEAFNHDEPLNNAHKQYKSIRRTFSIMWAILIVALFLFTVSLSCSDNCVIGEKAPAIEETAEWTSASEEAAEPIDTPFEAKKATPKEEMKE